MIDCLGNGNYLNVAKSFFFNTKVNAGFKHSKPLENVAPVHHLGIPVAKHMNTFYWLEIPKTHSYHISNYHNFN
jgi:hypothetical protein